MFHELDRWGLINVSWLHPSVKLSSPMCEPVVLLLELASYKLRQVIKTIHLVCYCDCGANTPMRANQQLLIGDVLCSRGFARLTSWTLVWTRVKIVQGTSPTRGFVRTASCPFQRQTSHHGLQEHPGSPHHSTHPLCHPSAGIWSLW